MLAYCVKCKGKTEIDHGTQMRMKNGTQAVTGRCQVCGTAVLKIVPALPPNDQDCRPLASTSRFQKTIRNGAPLIDG